MDYTQFDDPSRTLMVGLGDDISGALFEMEADCPVAAHRLMLEAGKKWEQLSDERHWTIIQNSPATTQGYLYAMERMLVDKCELNEQGYFTARKGTGEWLALQHLANAGRLRLWMQEDETLIGMAPTEGLYPPRVWTRELPTNKEGNNTCK